MALKSASVNRPIVLALCAWPMDKVWQTFTRQVLNISTSISQFLYQVQQKCWWRLQISSWNIARITESVSIKVTLFSLSMFHYSYTHQPGKTFSLTASIVLFSDPLETTASIPHRIKSQSMWTPGSLVTHQTQIVLIAAHSWDNIPWEFSGRWKVLWARIDYMMHYYF